MKAFSVLFLLLFVLVVCGDLISPSHPYIQVVGRSISNANSVVISWSGASINAKITGTSTLSVFLSQQGFYGVNLYYDVFIDGTQTSTLTLAGQTGQQEYFLATGLSSSSHTISLVRRNEASFGATTFYGFGVSSGASILQLPARPNRRIEFIGDSITCGSGALGQQPCGFGENQDAYLSHGPITARNLGADYFVTSWSGIGLVRNYADYQDQSTAPLPVLYEYTVGDRSDLGNWDFSKWVPHAVVINLGTNDFHYPISGSLANIYINGYYNFISAIKNHYNPDPAFFLVCGPMSNLYCSYAQQVANAVGATFIDLNGLLIQGCDYHPSVASHINMAAAETQSISAALGWAPVASSTTTGSPASTTGQGSTTGKHQKN